MVSMARSRLKLSDLPIEMQTLCFRKLVSMKDYLRFAAVCRSWKSIFLQNRHHLPKQNPMLMLSIKDSSDLSQFYDYSTKKIHSYCGLDNKLSGGDDCIGTAGCWLVIHKDDGSILLFNPFSPVASNQIILPHLSSYVDKVVLFNDPALYTEYIVMATGPYSGSFDIYKSSNNAWSSVEFDADINDVVCHNGMFIILSDNGISVFDAIRSKFVNNVAPPRLILDDNLVNFQYLVVSEGDILQVVKVAAKGKNDIDCATEKIQVYKLDRVARTWTEISNLGGRALFVGGNTSMAILASDFPQCKPNCIYFTNGPDDSGLYDMDEASIELYPFDTEELEYPFPCWITPSLFLSGEFKIETGLNFHQQNVQAAAEIRQ